MNDLNKNVVMGTCPVCHHVIRLAYRDKLHRVGYCTGCGLEYGNPEQSRYGIPRKVITDVEMRRLINEAYGQLIQHHPKLKAQLLMNAMNKASVRMTGYGVPDVSERKLRSWGYDLVAGYIVRREEGESGE